MSLGKDHKNHLLIIFKHIDMLLSDMERIMSGDDASHLFKPHFPDIEAETRNKARREIAEFRVLMSENLKNLGIGIPEPRVGALQAALTACTFVNIALEELKSGYMRGYGDLTRETAESLDDMVLRMQTAVSRIAGLLSGQTSRKD